MTPNWHDFLALQEGTKREIEASRPRSSRWSSFEKELIEKQPYCSFCGDGIGETELVGHHIFPYHLYPQWELQEWNILIVGESCSTGHHHLLLGHYGNFRKWNPDARELARIMLWNRQAPTSGFVPLPLFEKIHIPSQGPMPNG